jgi:hypothetical protein
MLENWWYTKVNPIINSFLKIGGHDVDNLNVMKQLSRSPSSGQVSCCQKAWIVSGLIHSKIIYRSRCLGLCETWVPLGPYRPGSRPFPTSGYGLPEGPPTCQWVLPDLTCGPEDEKTAWCARQGSPDGLRQLG